MAVGEEINDYRLGVIKDNPDLFVSVIFKTMKETEAPEFAEVENDSIKRLLKYQYIKYPPLPIVLINTIEGTCFIISCWLNK